jgi:hypothetical protein
MADSTEAFVRSLVRNLYYATEGKNLWWSLPHKMNSSTWDGIQKASDRGWMLQDGSSVCLTDAGRELVENCSGNQIPKSAAQLARPVSSYVS